MRELRWAAAGAWDRTAALMSAMAASMPGGKAIRPADLNPYRRKPPQRRTGPVTEAESSVGWAALDRFFGGPPRPN